VKKKIGHVDVSFFPKTAICLEGLEAEEDDDDPLTQIEESVDKYVRQAEKLATFLQSVQVDPTTESN